jgi:serine/threonine protein kinase
VSDFDILERLGDGSFSTVVLARYKGDGQCYAVKIVNKTLVLRNKVCCAATARMHWSVQWCHKHLPACPQIMRSAT